MEITTDYEIASANLAIALADDAVSTEQREEIAAAVGDNLDRLIEVVNTFIVSYNAKMYAGQITAATAKKTVKAEYKAIGFGKVLEYKWLENVIELFYDKEAFASETHAERLARIKEIYESNRACVNERIRIGVDAYVLRLLNGFGLVTEDLEFTKKVMAVINGYTVEQRESAILPPAIVTEL